MTMLNTFRPYFGKVLKLCHIIDKGFSILSSKLKMVWSSTQNRWKIITVHSIYTVYILYSALNACVNVCVHKCDFIQALPWIKMDSGHDAVCVACLSLDGSLVLVKNRQATSNISLTSAAICLVTLSFYFHCVFIICIFNKL